MDPEVKNSPIVTSRKPLYILLAILGIFFVGLLTIYLKSHRTRAVVSGFVSDPAINLETNDDRTNILFMGIGGEGHEAPDLTDSMIFVSLSHRDNSVSMISLPRDIWVDSMKDKINTAYHYGNEKRENGGLDLAKSMVGEVLSQPVHYALVLDFAGFIKAIDAVGGLDVMVDRSFDDYKYPIPGKENAEPESERYEHLHFDEGVTHMDGVTALKFARSRHAEGEEGTDFARSTRQQKIILAFRDRIMSSATLGSLDTLKNLFESISSSIDTDIEDDEFASLFRFFLAYEKAGKKVNTIDITNDFYTPKDRSPYSGRWVLVPVVSWTEIHNYVSENLAK